LLAWLPHIWLVAGAVHIKIWREIRNIKKRNEPTAGALCRACCGRWEKNRMYEQREKKSLRISFGRFRIQSRAAAAALLDGRFTF